MKKQEFRNFIKEVVKNVLRENVEPYDAETDQFGSAPRDRSEPSGGNLNIPEYPGSIIKQHTLDSRPMWFVYSSSDPHALILGFGNSEEESISNAKSTAKSIKHGVGGMREENIPNTEEHNYEEQGELKKINDILVVCEHANKRLNDPSYFPTAIKQIQKICVDLLRMHGAK